MTMNDDTMPALPATPGALGVGYSEAQLHAYAIAYANQQTARLRTALENEKARGIHSCHADCTRDGCVNRKLRAELATAREDERDRCARICEEQAREPECPERAQYCADAIRASATIGVQACRPEDRAMLATPEGAELVRKVAAAMDNTLYPHGGRPMTLRECMDAEDGGE